MSLSRRGGGLLELLVALTLTGILAALTQLVLARAALTLRDRSERIAAEHAVRVGLAAVRAALEAAGRDSADADLLAAGPGSFSVRVTRASGILCDTAAGLLTARAGSGWWHAVRAPVAGRDSLRVASPSDTGWRAFALHGAPAARSCPDGGPGIGLPIGPAMLGSIGPGSPVRVVEPVELRRYSSPPDDWLGQRLMATAQAVQPLAGPLGAAASWFAFETRAAAPASTPDAAAAARIGLEVRTERAGGIGIARSSGPRADSVRAFIMLVNAW